MPLSKFQFPKNNFKVNNSQNSEYAQFPDKMRSTWSQNKKKLD